MRLKSSIARVPTCNSWCYPLFEALHVKDMVATCFNQNGVWLEVFDADHALFYFLYPWRRLFKIRLRSYLWDWIDNFCFFSDHLCHLKVLNGFRRRNLIVTLFFLFLFFHDHLISWFKTFITFFILCICYFVHFVNYFLDKRFSSIGNLFFRAKINHKVFLYWDSFLPTLFQFDANKHKQDTKQSNKEGKDAQNILVESPIVLSRVIWLRNIAIHLG